MTVYYINNKGESRGNLKTELSKKGKLGVDFRYTLNK